MHKGIRLNLALAPSKLKFHVLQLFVFYIGGLRQGLGEQDTICENMMVSMKL